MHLHPIPASLGFCTVIPDFLSPEECRALIDRGEALGFHAASSDYPPSYRNNERLVIDDAEFAARLTQRLCSELPRELLEQQDKGVRWRMAGVNERLRWCRYRTGQAFHIHQDGVHHRGPALRSRLTFMIYLTDGDDFDGGDTLFFAGGPHTTSPGEQHPPVVARVRPRLGSLILFDHRIWHAGEAVTRGVKHIVRSDLMFEAVEGVAALSASDARQGYVWALCALPDGGVASGGRDTAIRLWDARGAAAGSLRGHEQSVLGLAVVDGQRLVSVSRDRSLRVWNLGTRQCEQVFRPHAAAILCVAAWNGLAISGGADGVVRVTRLDDAESATLGARAGWVWSVDVTEAGLLAAACEDGSVHCFDLREMQPIAVLPGDVALRAVAVSADGTQLAAGDITGRITRWMRDGGQWQRGNSWQAHAAAIRKLRFTADGALLSGGEDAHARRWTRGGGLAWEATHDNFVTDVLPMADGVLSCAYDGRITRHAA